MQKSIGHRVSKSSRQRLPAYCHAWKGKNIIRQTKDGNKRSLYVYLTDEGKRLQEIVNDTFEKVENEILGGISESEKTFINTFFKICNNMTNTEELQMTDKTELIKDIHIFTCWTFRQRTRKFYHQKPDSVLHRCKSPTL